MKIEKIKLENKGFEIDVIIKKINEIIYHVNCIDSFVEYPDYKVPEKETANSESPLLADVLAEIDERVSKRYGFYGWKSAVEEVLSKYFS